MTEELRRIAADLEKHYARLSILAAESLNSMGKESDPQVDIWSLKDAANCCFEGALTLQNHAIALDEEN